MAKIILYVGQDCHLCNQAKEVLYPLLSEFQLEMELVDIASDEALQTTYRFSIPVVKTDDGQEKGWPFTAGQVKRMLSDTV